MYFAVVYAMNECFPSLRNIAYVCLRSIQSVSICILAFIGSPRISSEFRTFAIFRCFFLLFLSAQSPFAFLRQPPPVNGRKTTAYVQQLFTEQTLEIGHCTILDTKKLSKYFCLNLTFHIRRLKITSRRNGREAKVTIVRILGFIYYYHSPGTICRCTHARTQHKQHTHTRPHHGRATAPTNIASEKWIRQKRKIHLKNFQ